MAKAASIRVSKNVKASKFFFEDNCTVVFKIRVQPVFACDSVLMPWNFHGLQNKSFHQHVATPSRMLAQTAGRDGSFESGSKAIQKVAQKLFRKWLRRCSECGSEAVQKVAQKLLVRKWFRQIPRARC